MDEDRGGEVLLPICPQRFESLAEQSPVVAQTDLNFSRMHVAFENGCEREEGGRGAERETKLSGGRFANVRRSAEALALRSTPQVLFKQKLDGMRLGTSSSKEQHARASSRYSFERG